MLNVAILGRERCNRTLDILREFRKLGRPITTTILETQLPQRLPHTLETQHLVHAQYAAEIGPRSKAAELWFRRILPRNAKEILHAANRLAKRKSATPVQDLCHKHEIPVHLVDRHSSQETIDALKNVDADKALLASSGWLLKGPLAKPGDPVVISAHPGLLPNHRSLDSLLWSLLAKDPLGMTAFILDEGVDTGPIITFTEVHPIVGEDLFSFRTRLDSMKPAIFHEALLLLEGGFTPSPQIISDGVHHAPLTIDQMRLAGAALNSRIASRTR